MPFVFKNPSIAIMEALNGISHTVWGMIILATSMWMGIHGKTELCYYFAGVGSTMLGLKQDQTNNFIGRGGNNSTLPPMPTQGNITVNSTPSENTNG